MLGKLIKHEWKYIWKKLVLLVLVMIAATVLGVFASTMAASFNESAPDVGSILFFVFGLFGFYGAMIVAVYGLLLISGIRFYKNIYGDEGYITNTLPVSARQLHIAKVIVYTICSLILTVIVMAGMIAVLDVILSSVLQPDASSMTSESLLEPLGISGVGVTIVFILMVIVSSFTNTTSVFASVVWGQTWKRHKKLGAFISYLILTSISAAVGIIATLPSVGVSVVKSTQQYNYTASPTPPDMLMQLFIITTVACLILGIVFYIITDRGMTKKLNLE